MAARTTTASTAGRAHGPPAGVRVRPVRPDDGEALWCLRLRALREDPDAFDQTIEDATQKGIGQITALVDAVRAGGAFVAVAESGPELVGLACLSRSVRSRSRHRARLWGMWVAPEARRSGVGHALVSTALDWAESRGVEMIDLWVVTDHVSAIRLYQEAGFAICGTAPDGMRWQGEPQDEHQMVIRLPRCGGPAGGASHLREGR